MTMVAPLVTAPAPAPTPTGAPPIDGGHGREYQEVAARVDRSHERDAASTEERSADDPTATDQVADGSSDLATTDDEPAVDADRGESDDPSPAVAASAVMAQLVESATPDDPSATVTPAWLPTVDPTADSSPTSTTMAAAATETSVDTGVNETADPGAPMTIDPALAGELASAAPDISSREPSAPAEGSTGAADVAEDAGAATRDAESEAPADAEGPGGTAVAPADDRSRPVTVTTGDGAVPSRVDGSTGVGTSGRAEAPSAADQPARTEAWEQVATVVRPLRLGADGAHRLAVQLRPDELGTVHLEVALRDGRFSLHAVAETGAARDVLSQSLPQLRAALTSAGIDLGTLDVSTGSSSSDTDGGGDPDGTDLTGRVDRPSNPTGPPAPVHRTHTTSGSVGPGAIDLAL